MLSRCVVLVTLYAFVGIPSPHASSKLLINSDFSLKADGGGPPPGWLIPPPASTKTLDANQPASRADGGGPPPGWLIPPPASTKALDANQPASRADGGGPPPGLGPRPGSTRIC